MAKARVVAVIGMHRSGTSLVARGLSALGVDLGESLAVESAPDNAKGHWEDQDVIQFNQRLLAALALEWDVLESSDGALMNASSLAPMVEQARDLIGSKISAHQTWAFKDPRTARLWPFWRRVLVGNAAFELNFVWMLRHPQAVAQSLKRRNGFDPLKSHLLWLNHNLIPFNDIAEHRHVLVDYDRMLNKPEVELGRIASALMLAPNDDAIGEFAGAFLDPGLSHFEMPETLSSPAGASLLAEQAYEALLQVASDRASLGDAEFLSGWRAVRREATLFSEMASRVTALTLSNQGLGQLHERLTAEFRRQQASAASDLQQQLAETLREQFTETVGRITNAESRIEAELRARHAETMRQLDDARTDLTDLRADTERSNENLALANRLLNEERYSIIKPLVRWVYRLGVAFIARLPGPIERRIRRVKRKLLRRSIPLIVDYSRPQSAARQRSGRGIEFLKDSNTEANKYDVLVCPVIDWHFRFQRPQHLALHLARHGHRVFYLSTTFDASIAPDFTILESPAPNVFLVTLCIPGAQPLIYQDLLRGQQLQQLTAAVGQLINAAGLENLLAIVDLPFWRPLAEAMPGCFVVYDCMDYHGGFSTNSRKMTEEEDLLVESADLVVTTSAKLSEIVGRSVPNVLIRNAGEVDYFRAVPTSRAYVSKRPVVGYLGAIAEWFDIELIVSAARLHPEWDFVLVGAKTLSGTSDAERLENIKWIGEVPYADAAAWVHSFDVALIPFKLTELTLCTNPVKVYEYLAAGKPVVATALPEVRAMGGVVHVADDRNHFIELLDKAMAGRGDATVAAERSQWAAAHDWKTRGEQLEEAIRSAFPKVSVIVLTYNNLEFTKACLQSLETHSCYPNWELVIVDNASSDGTADHLKEYAAANPRVKLVLNEENLGFAAGNNCGLRAADGDYFIVLNNDTYVTRGWMLDLVRHFRRSPDLGLLGPVTNNIGNEAKIEIHYTDMAEMASAAYAYTSARSGEELTVSTLAFFCAAVPGKVYEKIGGLDERFGLGFFEDDDYCRRVEQAGYRIAIAEDVFVHHHLSASFSLLEPARRQALFDTNRALYEERWGAWTPHRYRD